MGELEDKNVLIIDDDINLCRTLKYGLIEEGAIVKIATDGRVGIQKFEADPPDLVLLDIRMPEVDGWDTCQYLRMISDVPIIMLTSLKEDEEMIRGLNLGADDYITKPFNDNILHARIESVLRRAHRPVPVNIPPPKRDVLYRDDTLFIDVERQETFRYGELIKLSTTEYKILKVLLQRPNECVSYVKILETVWGKKFMKDTEYLHVYISNLRKKIESNPRDPQYIINRFRTGYFFKTGSRYDSK